MNEIDIDDLSDEEFCELLIQQREEGIKFYSDILFNRLSEGYNENFIRRQVFVNCEELAVVSIYLMHIKHCQ